MSNSTFSYKIYGNSGFVLIDFQKYVKKPYKAKYVSEKNEPDLCFILQKKGRLIYGDIGKLESPDNKTLKLIFRDEIPKEDINYFQNVLDKLIERNKQEQMSVEGMIKKTE